MAFSFACASGSKNAAWKRELGGSILRKGYKSSGKDQAKGVGPFRTKELALEDRQTVVFQLQHDAIHGGRINRPGAPAAGARPLAVAALGTHDAFEVAFLVHAPGQAFFLGDVGEELAVAVVADEVDRGGIVEVGVFIEAEASAAGSAERDFLVV